MQCWMKPKLQCLCFIKAFPPNPTMCRCRDHAFMEVEQISRFTDEEAGPQRGVSVTCHGGEAKICISFYYSVSNRIRARIYCLLSTRLFVKHFISWITSVNSHIPFVTPIVWITFGRIQRTERLSNFPRATLLACDRVGTQTLVFLTRSVRECYSYITTILKK